MAKRETTDTVAGSGEYPSLPTPEDVAKSIIKGLPSRRASQVLTALSLFSWVTLPINFLSQISEIALVVDFCRDLYNRLAGLRPLFDLFVAALSPVVTAWRALTAPLRQALIEWFPWVPTEAFEFLLAAALCLPPLLQHLVVRGTIRMRHVQLLEDLKTAMAAHERVQYYGSPETAGVPEAIREVYDVVSVYELSGCRKELKALRETMIKWRSLLIEIGGPLTKSREISYVSGGVVLGRVRTEHEFLKEYNLAGAIVHTVTNLLRDLLIRRSSMILLILAVTLSLVVLGLHALDAAS